MSKKIEMPTPEEFVAITELAGELQQAKLVEAVAAADRIAIEAKLAVLIPGKKDGQRTINLADKRKVVIERKLLYSADFAELEKLAIFKKLNIASPVDSKTHRVVNVSGYKWWEENKPEEFAEIAKHITVKPAKTAVKILPAK